MEADDRHEYTATLRVSSSSRTLADLARLLGESNTGYEIGDEVSVRLPGRTRTEALWSLESTIDRTHRLDEHLEEIVTFVETHRDVFTQLRDDCEVDIFCGLFTSDNINGGFVLEPSLAGRLSELQLPVIIDVG